MPTDTIATPRLRPELVTDAVVAGYIRNLSTHQRRGDHTAVRVRRAREAARSLQASRRPRGNALKLR